MTKRKTSILFISHDSSLTGAPILLINLLKLLSRTGTYDIRILLCRGGYLEDEFAKIAPTTVLKSHNYGKRKWVFVNLIDFLIYRMKVFFFAGSRQGPMLL